MLEVYDSVRSLPTAHGLGSPPGRSERTHTLFSVANCVEAFSCHRRFWLCVSSHSSLKRQVLSDKRVIFSAELFLYPNAKLSNPLFSPRKPGLEHFKCQVCVEPAGPALRRLFVHCAQELASPLLSLFTEHLWCSKLRYCQRSL